MFPVVIEASSRSCLSLAFYRRWCRKLVTVSKYRGKVIDKVRIGQGGVGVGGGVGG